MPVSAIWYAGAGVAALLVGRIAWQWLGFRQKRLITCPENQRPAGVQLAAWHAAFSGLGKPAFRLSACTRWPDRAGCGQECLTQIEAAPLDCEVRRILADWYRGKKCAVCGLAFEEILWDVRKPALLQADKRTMEWSQIAVDRLPEVLRQSAPVCFTCHMAGTLVREHPELAIDRSRAVVANGHSTGNT